MVEDRSQPTEKTSQSPEIQELTSDEIRGWAEYCCWVSVVLTPVLIWWNGPCVSDDQAVVRTGLMLVSILGAITLRIYSVWKKRRDLQ